MGDAKVQTTAERTTKTHLAGIDDDLCAADVDFLNDRGRLRSQRRDDACDVENSIGALECCLHMGSVAYVTSYVRHVRMFDHWQQHIENGDAVFLRFCQKQLDNAPADKATASSNHNDWT